MAPYFYHRSWAKTTAKSQQLVKTYNLLVIIMINRPFLNLLDDLKTQLNYCQLPSGVIKRG